MGAVNMPSGNTGEPRVSQEHPELFHYTSIRALEGILESNTLWATHVRYLNDSSETTLLWPMIEERFKEYMESAAKPIIRNHPEKNSEVEALGGIKTIVNYDAHIVVETMKNLLIGTNENPGMAVPFVVSFSTHTDEYVKRNGMLSQWRGYGNYDNVMVEFNTAEIEKILEFEFQEFEYFSCSIEPAIYYTEDLNITDCFPRLFETMKEYVIRMLHLHDERYSGDDIQESINAMARPLFPAIGRLKHKAFQEEHECRIIAGIPDEFHREKFEDYSRREICMKGVHYRKELTGSIPYIRLFENLDDALPITRIVVGPSRNQLANAEMVRNLVDRVGRSSEIEVECSDIPYVGST